MCGTVEHPHVRDGGLSLPLWSHMAIEDGNLTIPRNTLDLTHDDGARRRRTETSCKHSKRHSHVLVRCAPSRARCVGREWLGLNAVAHSGETSRCLGRAEDEIGGFQFDPAEASVKADAPSHLTLDVSYKASWYTYTSDPGQRSLDR